MWWKKWVAALAVVVAVAATFAAKTHADTNQILSTLDRLQFLGNVSQTLGDPSTQAAKDELQKQIDQRNQRLQQVQQQLDAAKKALGTTQTQRKSLQNEIATLEGNIKNLQLGIQKDQLTIDKLGFEIQGLHGDITTLQGQMATKQATIAVLMRELQKSEDVTPLVSFLKDPSLSQGLQAAHAVTLLQSKLSDDLAALRDMHQQVSDKLVATDEKQQEITQREQDLQNQKLIVQDQKTQRAVVLTQTKNQEAAYQKQVTALQAEQAKIAAEVEAIDSVLRGKINQNSLPNTGSGVLGVPIEGALGHITQGYGYTTFARNGYRGQRHNGVDFGTPVGTPVYAAEAGTVVGSANEDAFCPRGAYGQFVAINHTNGLSTVTGHLSRRIAQVGDHVTRGQLIGYSGMTGYATGPHVHFGVYAQSTFYIRQSPLCGPLPQGGDLNPMNYL